ncbi:SNF2-related protein [Pseudarthrobacter sp. P1]|uniref:DEAD/DEAH box helicase n=1 Tax=Pseudarthrobacter sp. P1 TaxID=3418418 RepID=UPI003CF55371
MAHDSAPEISLASMRSLVGVVAHSLGLQYSQENRVSDILWAPQQLELTGTVRGAGAVTYRTVVVLAAGSGGLEPVAALCTCPMGMNCKHAVALVCASNAVSKGILNIRPPAKRPSPWQRQLDTILAKAGTVEAPAPLGVQLELVDAGRSRKSPGIRLGARPVMLNAKGRWIYANLRWDTFHSSNYRAYYYGYARQSESFSDAQNRWMQDFRSLNDGGGYGSVPTLYMDDFSSPLLWELLARAEAADIVLRAAGPSSTVTIHSPVSLGIDVQEANGKLRLLPQLQGGDLTGESATIHPFGDPGHGLMWWDGSAETPLRERNIHLAPTAEPIGDLMLGLLGRGKPLEIPRNGRAGFTTDYLPQLARRVRLSSQDGAVDVPGQLPPRLRLTAGHALIAGTRRNPGTAALQLSWSWDYISNGQPTNTVLLDDGHGYRDQGSEAGLLREVSAVLAHFPAVWSQSFPDPLRAFAGSTDPVQLVGMDAARFTTDALPLLAAMERVDVDVQGESPDYLELTDAPAITVTAADTETPDWFDLGVSVSLGGRAVPFNQLFLALVRGEDYLLMENGNFFALDQPEFQQLRRLIEEARSLQDRDADGLRISRHQASLWDDFVELAGTAEQSESWGRSVGGLLDLSSIPRPGLPEDLDATLRPYQLEGFQWLAFLYSHGLGGVLADDMGLGKTLQTLALICHAREGARAAGDAHRPFLVVAPTSVVPNWAAESRRFAPSLRTVAVTETLKRTGIPLADMHDDVDVVVLSYALFRLDHEAYAEHEWAGLVLDEAQFVKNPATKASQQARAFPAPFKLAITGTPMENNLMELWSMFAITSPGLFPSAQRFEDYYRKPIEKDADDAKLAQLRRRIRPLIMRRTKELVAADLPPKQEQVLELALSPKHRTIYQRHLQRERQKVLGLLDDMDKNRFQIFRSLTMLR